MVLKVVRILLILLLIVSGCNRPSLKTYKRSQFLMGTIIEITVVSSNEDIANDAMTAAFKEIKRLEGLMSTYLPDSEFSKINNSAGIAPVSVDSEVAELIKTGIEISKLTGGGFNMAIGPAIKLWKITDGEREIPKDEELNQIRDIINYRDIEIDGNTVYLKKKGMRIDPGGIGKGYASDRAEKVLKEKNITSGIVAVAGDLKLFGSHPDGYSWRIGIRHPRRDGLLGNIDMTDVAVSTSGDYERYFIKDGIRYHHILDPDTLRPARRCQSVTIIAKKGILADAMATGIFVLDPDKGMALIENMPDVEGIIVDKDGKIKISSGLTDRIKLL
ncbi:MAG: FAD:protein FMN transferase [Nitrospirota bacterium]